MNTLQVSAAARQRLADGNERFASDRATAPHRSLADRERVLAGQHPFAAIVTCSDSRVPPELLFDCGIGDVFVIRTAGAVLDAIGRASLFYAIDHLDCPLIVVLGHSSCGAVTAACSTPHPEDVTPVDLATLLSGIRANASHPEDVAGSIAEHTRATAREIAEAEPYAERCASGRLEVVSAVYDLATGRVTWD